MEKESLKIEQPKNQAEKAAENKPDTQSRKYMLTFNNPQDHNITHEHLKLILEGIKSVVYFCLADEVGLENHTPHIHLFFATRSPMRFSRVKKLFPTAHIEPYVYGTCADCRTYVQKSGKWANDSKADTSVPGTFEEWGEMPNELGQGFRSDIAEIYQKIEAGLSNAQIMADNPETAAHIGKMDKIRQDVLEAKYREQWRDLDVTYIFGPTGTGKTRSVMDRHGYGNVYRVTDYSHPFDRYAQEPVLCMDEFRSSLLIGDMLDYLDGYPLALPARYANRQACYTTVYIVSNIDLKAQYPHVQENEPATWKAFLRRIHHVIEYRKNGPPIDHGNATEYIYPPPPPVPDWLMEAEQAKQDELF